MRFADLVKLAGKAKQAIGNLVSAARAGRFAPPSYGGHPRPVPRHPGGPVPPPGPPASPWAPAQPLGPQQAPQPLQPHPPLPTVPPSYQLIRQLRQLVDAERAGQFVGRFDAYAEQVRAIAHALQYDPTLPPNARHLVDELGGVIQQRDQRLSEIRSRRQREEEAENRQRAAEQEWPAEHQIDVTDMGRADVMQWPVEMRREVLKMHKTPGSSNVYAFTWYEDTEVRRHQRPGMADMGTLVVTFKDWEPGQKERSGAPGPTYAYSHVPRGKWEDFLAATSPNSAGVAVWDYLRVRGTISGHQHPYRLLSVTGDYIPRKATSAGFATRNLAVPAEEQESTGVKWRRSNLDPGPLSRFGQALPSESRPRAFGRPLSPWQWQAARTPPKAYSAEAHRNTGTPNNGRR